MLISGGGDGTVKLWNLDTHNCIFDLTTHTHYFFIKTLAFTGRYTFSTDDNKTWKIFDTWTLQEIWSVKERGGSIDSVGLHKDFFLLADEAQIRVMSWEGPRTLTTIGVKDVENICFTEGNKMFTGAGTGELKLWEWS
jgi:WD40 repeat protein